MSKNWSGMDLQIRKEKFEKLRHAHKMQELKLERENLDKSLAVIEKGIQYRRTRMS